MSVYGTPTGTVWAVAFFLLFQLSGQCAARRFLPGESPAVRLVLGSVCGSVMLQWFPTLFAFFLGFSVPAHLCGLACALVCGGLCLKGAGPSRAKSPTQWKSVCRFYPVILLMTLFFALLVWHSLRFENDGVYSSQATYGDTSMHLSFITSLARQQRFPPNYSLLPGYRLSYPFLSDSISSSLYLWGCSLKLAYFLPMLFAGAQVFVGFFLFAARLLKSPRRGALAWVLFFFNGGFGAVYFLGGGKENFSRIFTDFYKTPTNFVEGNIRWVNVVVDMMLPQRATLFGWAVLFPALYLLYRGVYEEKREYFLYTGILAGLLPMIHTHSLLALALICGGWLLFSLLARLGGEQRGALAGKVIIGAGLPAMAFLQYALKRLNALDSEKLLWVAAGGLLFCALLVLWLARRVCRREGWRPLASTWGILLLVTCALALPQLFYWTFRQVGSGGFLRGHFGWSVGEDEYLWFYLKNIGLTALLALAGLFTAGPESFGKYFPAPVIWFVAEFAEFQPNDYDNNKLLYVAFALLCCCAADFAAEVFRRLRSAPLRAGVGAAGLVLCMTSALLTMGRECVASYEIYGAGALQLCGYVEEKLPPDAIVLTDLRHNNEIASLTGRNVVCGSPAYLYYHGTPYWHSEQAVEKMYTVPKENLEWFREMKVDYVLVSDFERSSYPVEEAAIARLFEKVYDDGVRRLYRVRF